MPQTLAKKVVICFISSLIVVTCSSCKAGTPYLVKDYLNYLIDRSGIGYQDNFEDLISWQVIDEDVLKHLDDELTYRLLISTVTNLLQEPNDIDVLKQRGWLNKDVKYQNKVSEEVAVDVVEKLIEQINNKTFDNRFEYTLLNDVKYEDDQIDIGDIVLIGNEFKKVNSSYEYEDAQFNEVFSYLNISNSFEIDFNDTEIIPLQDEDVTSKYVNNKYHLLSSKNHTFSSKGYRISYTFNNSGIDIRVSKNVDGINVYADASIRNVKPSFKWTSEQESIKDCYFNVSMNTTTSLGASVGKYDNNYLKLKDLDGQNFIDNISNMFDSTSDSIEAIIPICEIKTPIPNIPIAKLNMTIGIKIYVSGKVEVVMYNNHSMGFEIKNGTPRFFYEHKDDLDTIISSSAKLALAINFGVDAANFRLCDIELDGGIKAELKSTVHIYDTYGNIKSNEFDISYSTLQELSKENSNIYVCGDVSLYWLLDLICNTSRSVLYKFGFSKTFNILNEDDQVFNNLHHIENGQFVKKCTRKNHSLVNNLTISSNPYNKIELNSYAEVLLINDCFEIEIIGLPEGYNISDIYFESSNANVATVNGGIIKALSLGSSKIRVYSKDNKYNSYINVLVSTG